MPFGQIAADSVFGPPDSPKITKRARFSVAALILSLGTVSLSTYAYAAGSSLELSVDALAAGFHDGASHVLFSIDNPASMVTTQNTAPVYAASNIAVDTASEPGCYPAFVRPATVSIGAVLQSGTAAWYGAGWQGRRTASGARYNPEALTAASHTLPLGTRVLVTLEGTVRSVLVTITDRQGTAQRVIDLSKAAARKLGLIGRGTARVVIRRA